MSSFYLIRRKEDWLVSNFLERPHPKRRKSILWRGSCPFSSPPSLLILSSAIQFHQPRWKWSSDLAGKLVYSPASSELENVHEKCHSKAEEEEARLRGGRALKRSRCFPRPCPSAVGSRGKPDTKKGIYSCLCWLVPAWFSHDGLQIPAPLHDKTRETWKAEVEMAQLSSLKSCRN